MSYTTLLHLDNTVLSNKTGFSCHLMKRGASTMSCLLEMSINMMFPVGLGCLILVVYCKSV